MSQKMVCYRPARASGMDLVSHDLVRAQKGLMLTQHLVIDDAPHVRHHTVGAVGEGVIAHTGSPKGVAAHLDWQRLQSNLDVVCCQAGECAAERVASHIHL